MSSHSRRDQRLPWSRPIAVARRAVITVIKTASLASLSTLNVRTLARSLHVAAVVPLGLALLRGDAREVLRVGGERRVHLVHRVPLLAGLEGEGRVKGTERMRWTRRDVLSARPRAARRADTRFKVENLHLSLKRPKPPTWSRLDQRQQTPSPVEEASEEVGVRSAKKTSGEKT